MHILENNLSHIICAIKVFGSIEIRFLNYREVSIIEGLCKIFGANVDIPSLRQRSAFSSLDSVDRSAGTAVYNKYV